jgi:hypothetical protein
MDWIDTKDGTYIRVSSIDMIYDEYLGEDYAHPNVVYAVCGNKTHELREFSTKAGAIQWIRHFIVNRKKNED